MLNRMSNHAWVCKICSRDHPTKQCPEIKDVSTPRKQQKCQSRGLCIRCLEDQHVGNCRNQNILCRKCLSRDHFTVMHSRIYDASDSSMETESSEEEEEKKCIICLQAHPISNCYQFLSMPVEERIMLCKARGICQVCLSKEHQGTCGPPIPNCKICHSIGHSVYLHDAPGGRELCLLCPPGSRHLLEDCTSFLCMAIDARINRWSRFDRKNYFYADLPQGYQISQLYHPLVGEGHLDVAPDEKNPDAVKRIGIERIHVEQDAGKLMHDQHPRLSYVDLNRSGVALMEVAALCDAINRLENLRLRGLMAIPAPCADVQQQRLMFRPLMQLLQSLAKAYPQMDTLSIGMSGDYAAAIAEGSTIVRIGAAIFGARQ